MNNNYYIGVGRRKEATARVYLKEGTGKAEIRTRNGKGKNSLVKKIQTEIAELKKSIDNLDKTLSNQKGEKKPAEQALEVVKFELEEKVIELKKQLKQVEQRKKQAKELKDYFYMEPSLCEDIYQPLKLFNKEKDYDLIVRVKGSGFHSQAEAIKLGVARALLKVSPEYKPTLKSFSLLKTDSRKKEREHIGFKTSRRPTQFSKR